MQAYKTSQGNWQVNFSENGKQRTLYLGRDFTSGSADRVARIVSDILSCRNRGDSVPLEILRRVEKLPERIQRSFEKHGLIGGVSVWKLSDLLEKFYETKIHLRQTTQDTYRNYGNHLIAFFGADCRLDTIGKLDCERFRDQYFGYQAACTVSRGLSRCQSIFRYAVDAGWLRSNPFEKTVKRVSVNLQRQFYVDRETIYKVMSCCRDDYDRLVLALARFGGLRIPSEIRHLRYCDFVDNVIRIHHDTKTGAREVPLFGEIREIFDRIVVNLGKKSVSADSSGDSAALGDFVFASLGNKDVLRDRVLSAINASGVDRWEKLFVNLRSSCITDMVERGYSEKILDAMFGNSSEIRRRHYIQFRKDRDYGRVLRENEILRKISVASDARIDIDSLPNDVLLVLRDLLVTRFGTGRKAS